MTSIPPIALSTGWLFAAGYDTIEEQTPFLRLVDGAEFSVTTAERTDTYQTTVPDLDYCSYHLGVEDPTPTVVADLADQHPPRTTVLHPTDLSDARVQALQDHNLPVSIENMDKQKDSGYTVTELAEWLTTYDVDFTLDIQHAYEHDATMEYAWELVDLAGDRLAELHVSGETDTERHALLHKADNRETLTSFLQSLFESDIRPPLVIEGKYETVGDVEKEFTYLRQSLD